MLEEGSLIADRYRIRTRLGAGGMGSVFAAFDELVGEDVAIKLLDAGGPEAVDRFRTEVRLARRVTHRNVGRTYDIGVDGPRIFLTMELLGGQTLLPLLRRAPVEAPRAATIIGQVALGLAAAHEAEVVHRDLKPSNVVLTEDHRVVVIDWGIAVLRDAVGGVAGTPDYMAPEQLRGERSTPAQDVYAVGCMLFELLTGARPFRGETSRERAVARLDVAPDLEVLPPTSALTDWVRRCMALDPRDRPDARAVADALLAEPVSGVAPGRAAAVDPSSDEPTRVEQAAVLSERPGAAETALGLMLARALVRSSEEELPRALATLDQTIEGSPALSEAHALRALVATALVGKAGELPQATTAHALDSARRFAPEHPDTLTAQALDALGRADYPRGLRALHQVLAIDPRHARAHEQLGRLECEAGHAERGVKRIIAAVGLEPSLRRGLAVVARAHALRGRAELFDHALSIERELGAPTLEGLLLEARYAAWWGDTWRAERVLFRAPGPEQGPTSPAGVAHAIAMAVIDHGQLWAIRERARREPTLAARIELLFEQLVAELEGAIGDPLRALEWIERAEARGLIDVEWLACCPAFDVLREEPRFVAALERVRTRASALWTEPPVPLPR